MQRTKMAKKIKTTIKYGILFSVFAIALVILFGLKAGNLKMKPKIKKESVSSQAILTDSLRVGKQIFDSGFEPTFLIALWRGGTPLGMGVTEYFCYKGKPIENHFAISTRAYNHDQLKGTVDIFGLQEIAEKIGPSDRILIVDDLIDTGSTIKAVLEELKQTCGDRMPEMQNVKVATIYCKPKNSDLRPDFYLHETDAWLVFPHEIEGLTQDEIVQMMGQEIADILA